MKKNSGISLAALVITIIVTIILVTITVITVSGNIDDAAIAGLMNDLKEVEDSFSASIVDRGTSEFETMTKNQVLALVDSSIRSEFENELALNGDSEESTFYKVNLTSIGILKSNKGTLIKGSDDLYVVTKESLHAYYLKAVKVDGVFYFSISSKIKRL